MALKTVILVNPLLFFDILGEKKINLVLFRINVKKALNGTWIAY